MWKWIVAAVAASVVLAAAGIGTLVYLRYRAVAEAADTWEEIEGRDDHELIWGGDMEGGGPYVYMDDHNQLVGFEVDLMNELAKRIGAKAKFKQRNWSTLASYLQNRDFDVIANGYELTPGRQRSMLATMPYYVYELQLIKRHDDATINSWDDLKNKVNGRRRKIGVLTDSGAENYAQNILGTNVKYVRFDGTTDALKALDNGSIDATVQDLPASNYYVNPKHFPRLFCVGPPVKAGYYVIYLRQGNEKLRDKLNAALLEMIQDGSLHRIYDRHRVWDNEQKQLGTPGLGSEAETSAAEAGWKVVERGLPLLLESAGMTVILTVLAMPLAILMGLAVAVGRLYGPRILEIPLLCYVEFLRGTPLLFQLFAMYFLLPGIGIRLPAELLAVLGLAINYSAYESEIYRAGLLAIPAGQMEAALALGMSRWTALCRIIIPQAVRLVIPPVTNDFIALFKDTSLCSVVTVVELTKQYSILANSNPGAFLELGIVTAALYLLMSIPLSIVAKRLERRRVKVVI